MEWGYFYVMEDFKFYIILFGKLDVDVVVWIIDILMLILLLLLFVLFVINDIGLVGECVDGWFEVI